jgi:hypothetical protein
MFILILIIEKGQITLAKWHSVSGVAKSGGKMSDSVFDS